MMRILTLLFMTLICIGTSFSQETDPILLEIGNKHITRSEFEYTFNKNNSLNVEGKKDLDDYLELFINFKLKVAEAEALKLDTLKTFKYELEGYRRQLSKSYLTDQEAEDRYTREKYDQMVQAGYPENAYVMHIFKYLPQNASKENIKIAEHLLDSIYSVLSASTDPDFEYYVKKYSDDPNAFSISYLQTPEEFERVAFTLKEGEYSKPFFSPVGVHIVKLIARMPMPEYDKVKKDITMRTARINGISKGSEVVVERLKNNYNYTENKEGIEELLTTGKTDKNLFVLDGKAFNGDDFSKFALTFPQHVKNQWKIYVIKSVLDYEYENLENKYPNFRMLMNEYKEGMLLFEISKSKVWERAAADSLGLQNYFSKHKSEYKWKEPRFKGMVIQCSDKLIAKQAKKIVKDLPLLVWSDTIQLIFNSIDSTAVNVVAGSFERGDNLLVDQYVFKVLKNNIQPDTIRTNYNYTTSFGKKHKKPTAYTEVLGPLTADYQNYLEELWVNELRRKYRIVIDKEVLKTVNNHRTN